MTDQTNTSELPEGAVQITNMDQLAFLVAGWFDNGHAQGRQMLEVPDGQPITVTFEKDGQPEELILTGDALKGFKAGVIVMSNIFGQLPFGRTEEPASTEKPADIEVNEAGRLQLVASNDVEQPSGD